MFGILHSHVNGADSLLSCSEEARRIRESEGYVITEKALLYKIPVEFIFLNLEGSNNRCVNEYVNKRLKWRENRLTKIGTTQERERRRR
jgi:hypothetical protein